MRDLPQHAAEIHLKSRSANVPTVSHGRGMFTVNAVSRMIDLKIILPSYFKWMDRCAAEV